MNVQFSTKRIRILLIIAFSIITLVALYFTVVYCAVVHIFASMFGSAPNFFEIIWEGKALVMSVLFSITALIGVCKYFKTALLFAYALCAIYIIYYCKKLIPNFLNGNNDWIEILNASLLMALFIYTLILSIQFKKTLSKFSLADYAIGFVSTALWGATLYQFL